MTNISRGTIRHPGARVLPLDPFGLFDSRKRGEATAVMQVPTLCDRVAREGLAKDISEETETADPSAAKEFAEKSNSRSLGCARDDKIKRSGCQNWGHITTETTERAEI